MADGRDGERCMTQHTDETKQNISVRDIARETERALKVRTTLTMGGGARSSKNLHQGKHLNSTGLILHYLII